MIRIAALALATAGCAGAAPAWTAYVESYRGDTYAVDSADSLEDCMAGLRAWDDRVPVSYCQPRLIGLGCEGADGPLYAVNESDFPRCESIRAIR